MKNLKKAMKFFTPVAVVLAILSPNIALASACPFSFSVPEYYEQISEEEWYTDSFTINGEKTEISITAKHENSDLTYEEAFSSTALKDIQSEIQNTDGFKKIHAEPKTESTEERYQYIVTSYVFEEDGTEQGAILYFFYSENTRCTICFVATNPIFLACIDASDAIVNTITFEQDFYINKTPVEQDFYTPASDKNANLTENNADSWRNNIENKEEDIKKRYGFGWFLLTLSFVLFIGIRSLDAKKVDDNRESMFDTMQSGKIMPLQAEADPIKTEKQDV